MKRSLALILGFFITSVVLMALPGCGSGKDQAIDPIDAETTGLQVNVRNSISAEIATIRVCPLPVDTFVALGSMNPLSSTTSFAQFSVFLYRALNQGLCISLEGGVKNGVLKKFFVAPERLERLFRDGNGSIFFFFSDSEQRTVIPGPCWELPHTLQNDFQKKQIFQVEVQQKHLTSYTCKTEKR